MWTPASTSWAWPPTTRAKAPSVRGVGLQEPPGGLARQPVDLGPRGIRVNAISAGAMRTLALAGISGGRGMVSQGRAYSALKEDTSMEGIAGAALWLLSDLGRSTTGEVVHVDAGFHIIGLPEDAAES